MPDQRLRSLRILAAIQAASGGLTAVVIFALFGMGQISTDRTLSLIAATLGTVGLIYYLTIHQFLDRKRPALSTLILSVITVLNIILVIISTGGLDSPYYSLWLLAIIVAGIFGVAEIIGTLVITVLYYLSEIAAEGFHAPFMRDHIVQFLITLAAAGLAAWVNSRNRRVSITTSKLEKLSGQLSTEQLKADAIMSSIGEGVMVIDGSRRIQLFNKAAQELTGWDESSAQNIDFNLVLQLKTLDDQPLNELNDPFADAWKKGETIVRDNLVMNTRAGRKVQLNLSISPINDANGNPNGAIALFRDISKEKEVERQKDEFVSTASHEMRTPVAAIEGYISLAMNANVATIDDRAKKYLDKAHDTIQHLGELFRDLLSVTKAEEGGLAGKTEAVDMGHLMQGATDDMQFAAQKRNLTLVYQIGGQSGKAIAPLYYVAGNGERLREVVMNLMDNAIKYTAEGGIRVTLEGNDKEVSVGVSDTGPGIAAEDVPHLFQKFYRIDNSATRTIGGTGLGLYLCRRVIELFNGRIWVESKLGEGSVFRFSLPRLTQAEAERLQAQTGGNQTAPSPSAIPAPTPAPSPQTPAAPATPIPMPVPVAESGPAITPAPVTLSAAPAERRVLQDLRRRVQ